MASSSITLYKQVVDALRKGTNLKPVYWLEGGEAFFIDSIVDIAEETIIPKAHKAFNERILFGQDSKMVDVISTCKQAPVVFERQLVIIKEAQFLSQIDKLQIYLEHPSPYTVLVVAYKEKTIDKRTALAKTLAKLDGLFSFPALYPNELSDWVGLRAHHYGLKIVPNALELLLLHVGNHLSLIDQELKKLALNVQNRPVSTDDIYQYIGVNKAYNFFELQTAIAHKDVQKAYQIIEYFRQNEKSFSLQYILVMLYGFFSKLYILYGSSQQSSKDAAVAIGVSPYFINEYLVAKKNYSFKDVCTSIVLINQCYRKSVGIRSSPLEKDTLLVELLFSLFHTKKLIRATERQ